MSLPSWLSDVCGVVGTLGFMLMLLPQVAENARNKSTEGLSMALVFLWHAAAILSAAFFLCSDDLFMILSMASFATCCSIIEGQYVGYSSKKGPGPNCLILAVSALGVTVSTGIVFLLVMLFKAVPASTTPVGDITPSFLLGLGFLPQYYTFLSTWSIKGYSFGVTAFDVTASVANTVVLLGSNMAFAEAAASAAPFLVIICMHAGLVILAAVITCSSKRTSADVDQTSSQDGHSVSKDEDASSALPAEP